jgi:hypothetical protein
MFNRVSGDNSPRDRELACLPTFIIIVASRPRRNREFMKLELCGSHSSKKKPHVESVHYFTVAEGDIARYLRSSQVSRQEPPAPRATRTSLPRLEGVCRQTAG